MADATTPTYTETATSNVPEWARKYVQDILGFGAALTYPKVDPATGKLTSGFQPYQGELVAGLSPLQQQAMGDLSRMQVSPELGQAVGFTGLAALQAQNLARYNPLQAQQYYQSPFDQPRTQGQGGPYTNVPPGKDIYASATEPYPGMPMRSGTVAPAVMPEPSQYESNLGGTNYQVTPPTPIMPTPGEPPPSYPTPPGPTMPPSPSFGDSPLARYMSPYMQDVVEQQKQQAIKDYSRQIPGMQASAARYGARGGTREALLQSEARRGLSEQLGNIQATGLQNAYQQAAQQAMQEAGLRAQYGLAGQQLGEQSRQFGAGLGLQGLQQQMAAAGQLGQLGQQQYQQRAGITQAQLGAGAQQQALKQQMLSSQYQRFIDEMQYPYKQLEYMSNLIRGIPSSDTTTSRYTPFSSTAALTGILGSGGGLGSLFGGGR